MPKKELRWLYRFHVVFNINVCLSTRISVKRITRNDTYHPEQETTWKHAVVKNFERKTIDLYLFFIAIVWFIFHVFVMHRHPLKTTLLPLYEVKCVQFKRVYVILFKSVVTPLLIRELLITNESFHMIFSTSAGSQWCSWCHGTTTFGRINFKAFEK